MLRSETTYPLMDIDPVGSLKKAWEQGWMDDFSEDHFLIKAINKQLDMFPKLYQIPTLYSIGKDSFQENFCINLSCKIGRLIDMFGEDNIQRFFKDQLSAGKDNYDEDQFFRALTEVSVLSFLCMNSNSGDYEPKTNGKKNPEARFNCNNGVVVDVEVKTPGFRDFNDIKDIVMPTVLLDDDGRKKFIDFCRTYNLNGAMPRVMKIKDFLNSAAEKFEVVDHVNHMNLLYINWSLSEFDESGFQEAFSLMAHPINGIMIHKKLGLEIGVKEEVYEKITAIIVYTESLQGLMFGDFRWICIRGNQKEPQFGIIGMHNNEGLFDITGMNPYSEQLVPILTGIFSNTKCVPELMSIISKHMKRP